MPHDITLCNIKFSDITHDVTNDIPLLLLPAHNHLLDELLAEVDAPVPLVVLLDQPGQLLVLLLGELDLRLPQHPVLHGRRLAPLRLVHLVLVGAVGVDTVHVLEPVLEAALVLLGGEGVREVDLLGVAVARAGGHQLRLHRGQAPHLQGCGQLTVET